MAFAETECSSIVSGSQQTSQGQETQWFATKNCSNLFGIHHTLPSLPRILQIGLLEVESLGTEIGKTSCGPPPVPADGSPSCCETACGAPPKPSVGCISSCTSCCGSDISFNPRRQGGIFSQNSTLRANTKVPA